MLATEEAITLLKATLKESIPKFKEAIESKRESLDLMEETLNLLEKCEGLLSEECLKCERGPTLIDATCDGIQIMAKLAEVF